MEVIGLSRLTEFGAKHADAKRAVEAWLIVVEASRWSSPHQVKAHYPSTDFIGSNKAIFDIKGNRYRLVVKIDYLKQRAVVEWLGTHAEYERMRF